MKLSINELSGKIKVFRDSDKVHDVYVAFICWSTLVLWLTRKNHMWVWKLGLFLYVWMHWSWVLVWDFDWFIDIHLWASAFHNGIFLFTDQFHHFLFRMVHVNMATAGKNSYGKPEDIQIPTVKLRSIDNLFSVAFTIFLRLDWW